MDTTALLQGITLLFIPILGWSLQRNIKALDKSLGSLNKRLDGLAETVGRHEISLTAGNGEFRSIREEIRRMQLAIDGLENRERTRGCGPSCRYQDDRRKE